jgi:hypothetical protein
MIDYLLLSSVAMTTTLILSPRSLRRFCVFAMLVCVLLVLLRALVAGSMMNYVIFATLERGYDDIYIITKIAEIPASVFYSRRLCVGLVVGPRTHPHLLDATA